MDHTLSLVLDMTFGLILKMRPNSGLILKIRPNACHHFKNLCKIGLRPKFGLRTNSDLFYQVTHRVSLALNDLVEVSLFIKSHKTGPRHIFTVTHGFQTASQDFPLLVSTQTS